MGDLITEPTEGELLRIPTSLFESVRARQAPPQETAAVFADLCRLNILYMICRAGSGHIGTSFSSIDILTWLHLFEMTQHDVFFSSKGHDAPALYSIKIALGHLPETSLDALRRLGGLPGHPDVRTPGIVTNTGSLGMGISKAIGIQYARRRNDQPGRTFVLLGDGELQEGQIWESLIFASNASLGGLSIIVDNNKIQSDFLVSETMDLGDLVAKFTAFGCETTVVDGHDFATLEKAFAANSAAPQVIIANTVKGKGVSAFERLPQSPSDRYLFHSGAPKSDVYLKASKEIVDRLGERLKHVELPTAIKPEKVFGPVQQSQQQPQSEQRLIDAYGQAVLRQGRKRPELTALDTDLIFDMGLLAFREELPDQFVECGIAEQNMVSQAGAMALQGLLPICHSFACFLTPRANEQMYNNATEGTKVIYVGGLAGMIPGGPGHSHQSVRDIALMGSLPGLVAVEPSCEAEVGALVDYLIDDNAASGYLRMVSVPWPTSFPIPDPQHSTVIGQGNILAEGSDAMIVASGPIMLSIAWNTAQSLNNSGSSVGVIAMPWLNRVDSNWLHGAVGTAPLVVTLDNHLVSGGQGQMIAQSVAAWETPTRVVCFGLETVPPCGTTDEVLDATGMSSSHLHARIEDLLTANAQETRQPR